MEVLERRFGDRADLGAVRAADEALAVVDRRQRQVLGAVVELVPGVVLGVLGAVGELNEGEERALGLEHGSLLYLSRDVSRFT